MDNFFKFHLILSFNKIFNYRLSTWKSCLFFFFSPKMLQRTTANSIKKNIYIFLAIIFFAAWLNPLSLELYLLFNNQILGLAHILRKKVTAPYFLWVCNAHVVFRDEMALRGTFSVECNGEGLLHLSWRACDSPFCP